MNNEDGYTKLWYTKASLRWLGSGFDVVALCLFGGTWAEEYDSIGYGYMGIWWLVVLAPLISLIVNLVGLLALFLIRRKLTLNPAWLLAGDVFAGTVLATTQGLFYEAADNLGGYEHGGTGQVQLRVVWDLSLCALICEFFVFLVGIWDTHRYRKMMRVRKLAARSAGLSKEEGNARDCEDVEMDTLPSTPSPSTGLPQELARPELAGRIRVELPDGQIVELPEGSRVELSHDARAELPGRRSVGKLETQNLMVEVSPVELESPSPSSGQSLRRSGATAWSFG